jgi:hypothetical protein
MTIMVLLVNTLAPPLPIHAAGASNMYVVNLNTNTISRANVDGSSGVSLGNLSNTLNTPAGIALDVANGKLYVTNAGNNTISQANLDGSGGVSLGNLGGTLNGPWAIALDVPPDTTAPTVTAFTAPASSSSLTIPISAFTATDAVGVTGYLITTSSTPHGWGCGLDWLGSNDVHGRQPRQLHPVSLGKRCRRKCFGCLWLTRQRHGSDPQE